MLDSYKSSNTKNFTCSENIHYLSFLKLATELSQNFKLLQPQSSMHLKFVSFKSSGLVFLIMGLCFVLLVFLSTASNQEVES